MTTTSCVGEPEFDVIVVGAGPSGLMLANFLGQAGVATLVVEANPATVGEPRAVSIDDESLRAVQAIGLLDAVTAQIVPGYGSDYRSPRGQSFLKVHPVAQPYGHPRRNAFRQPIFEAALRAGLERFDSVVTRFSTRVAGFDQDANGVSVLLPGNEMVRARFLIGCDGASSFVRETLGYRLDGTSMDERWLILDLENSPVPERETIVFCNPDRPCIALPGPNLTRRYEFKVLSGEDEAALLSAASVAALMKSHGAAPESVVIRKTIYHFHARVADHWGRGRIWLAGDAAHLSPPFAGQGMNSGVRDAWNIAWKLAAIVQGKFGVGLLESYEIERREHVWAMIRLAMRMGAIMGPATRSRGLATRMFFRALGLWPAARSYFAEMKYKPPPRFSAGFVVSGDAAVGQMIAQPAIAGTPFDDWLGMGFVVLGVDIPEDWLAAVDLGEPWDGLARRRIVSSTDVPGLARHSGQILLLRPDRYVMARFSIDRADEVKAALSRMHHATFQEDSSAPASDHPAGAAFVRA